jgi:hypothetical protein
MRFFDLDSFIVFSKAVCLNFFATSESALVKSLLVEGKLILNDKSIIEGPATCYSVRSPQKPQRASSPTGMGIPMILPTPSEYRISFPPNVDPSALKCVEWTVSILG